MRPSFAGGVLVSWVAVPVGIVPVEGVGHLRHSRLRTVLVPGVAGWVSVEPQRCGAGWARNCALPPVRDLDANLVLALLAYDGQDGDHT